MVNFYVSTNGRKGHCSCGKNDASFVDVKFVDRRGNLRVDELNCCEQCFSSGGFIPFRFFQIMGYADKDVKIIKGQ